MPESSMLALTITSLGLVTWWLIRGWAKNWKDRLVAQDKRLDDHDTKHSEHDVNHAVLKANLEHIRDNTDEMRKDVKDLLRHTNGKRTASGG